MASLTSITQVAMVPVQKTESVRHHGRIKVERSFIPYQGRKQTKITCKSGFLQDIVQIKNWMDYIVESLLGLTFKEVDTLWSRKVSKVWLSRNIKLATRIQYLQTRDYICNSITCNRQSILCPLCPFNLVAWLFKFRGRGSGGIQGFLSVLAVTTFTLVFN